MNRIRQMRRIGIFGHVGNGNLGDEAIIAAVVQNIRSRHPKAKIYGFTANPKDTEARHKLVAFPIRRVTGSTSKRAAVAARKISESRHTAGVNIKTKLKQYRLLYVLLRGIKECCQIPLYVIAELKFLIQCYRNVQGIDLLIIAGSQQLIDYIGGPWEHAYNVFKWVVLAKTTKANIVFLSVGVGPIRSRLGRFFVRKSLALARYRSYRDETSRKLVQELGISGENNVFPDLVYSLKIDAVSTSSVGDDFSPVVGINPVPFLDEQYWEGASPREYAAYIGKLANFALWAMERGYRILFFPTQLRLDPPVIADIMNVMRANANRSVDRDVVNKPILSFDDLLSAISMTSMVVATRFHGIVIPYLLNRPVVGIAYQKKTIDLMAQMGQSDYVVDINSFDADSLKTRFLLLESRCKTIKKEIEDRRLGFRQALQDQYDQVLDLI